MSAARAESLSKPTAGSGEEQITADLLALYSQQERRIYRLCRSYLRNASDAEDATQETFIRAARRLDQLSGDPCAYLTAVARNVSCDFLRHRARAGDATRRTLQSVEQRGDAESAVLARATLQGVLVSLQRREREMLLDSFAGYSYEEISRRKGMSVPAVASIISRARQRARRTLDGMASALIPAAALRRLHARLMRCPATPLMQRGSEAASSLQASALLIGSVVTCLLASTLGAGSSLRADARAATADWSSTVRAPLGSDLSISTFDRNSSGPSTPISQAAGSRRAGPVSSSSVSALGAIGEILAPPPARQQDTAFYDVVASPHYAQDGIVYASGDVVNGCRRASCPVLFRSADRGVSWQQVTASGFAGGDVLLPPGFPIDPTMFTMSNVGLARSDDAGQSFVPVVPLSAPAAAVPESPPGDARILIATNPPLIYSERSGLVSAGVVLPPDLTEIDDVAFAGGTGHLVVTGMRPDPAGTAYQAAVVVDCNPSCRYIMTAAHDVDLHVVVSTQFARDGTYFVYSTQHAYATRDAGASMSVLATPAGRRIVGLALSPSFGSDGRASLSAYSLDSTLRAHPEVVSSADGGYDFPRASSAGLPISYIVSSLLILADGRSLGTLSGPDSTGLFGIRCSMDGGVTWRLSC